MSGPSPTIPSTALAQREQLVEIYIRAQKRLVKQLTGAALTDFTRFRIQEQLTQINAIVAALNADVKDALPGLVPAYYKHGADLAGVAIQAQGVKVSALNLGSRIHTAAIQAVAEQMVMDLAKANTSMKESGRRILRETQQTLIQEKQINKIISEGLVTGESRRETSARLREALREKVGEGKLVQAGKFNYTPEYYAELVTRTRTREAVTQGSVTRSMEFGITLFQVSIHDNPCPQCAQYQGKVYSVVPDSGFPMLEFRPPFHPHCVLPETPVFAPGQRAASVATYNGPIIDLRLSNSAFVSVTPNHMFLTPTGFACAKDLREGDDVLCSALFEDVVLRNPDNYNRPPAIADVVKTLAGTQGMTTSGVPVSPEYLHGDARFMNGNIDIVRPDGLLWSSSDAEIAEHFRHLDFSGADVSLFGLNGCRDTASMLQRLALSTNSVVGLSRESQASLWPHFRHAEPHGFAPGTLLNPAFTQNAINHDLGAPVGSNQFANTFSGDITTADFLGWQQDPGPRAFFNAPGSKSASDSVEANSELASNIGNRDAGAISLARVVFKGLRDYSGHVYDLQTVSSLYVCNGIISSNCRHVLLPYVERPGKEAQHEAIKAFSNIPAQGGTGYDAAVSQARATGGLRKKQLPGETRTKPNTESGLIASPGRAMFGRGGTRLVDTVSENDYIRLGEILGDKVTIIDARLDEVEANRIKQHMAGLASIPDATFAKLKANGLGRVYIGKGGVSDFPGHENFRGVQIPDAPKGITWDYSRGAFHETTGNLILGTGNWGIEDTAIHEIGHALGYLNGYENDPIVVSEYNRLSGNNMLRERGFYPNGKATPRGRKEFFAESVRLGIIHQEALEELFSKSYYDFIVKTVITP